jgi:hypothetical protein
LKEVRGWLHSHVRSAHRRSVSSIALDFARGGSGRAKTSDLYEEGNLDHRVRVEHSPNVVLVRLGGEDGQDCPFRAMAFSSSVLLLGRAEVETENPPERVSDRDRAAGPVRHVGWSSAPARIVRTDYSASRLVAREAPSVASRLCVFRNCQGAGPAAQRHYLYRERLCAQSRPQ